MNNLLYLAASNIGGIGRLQTDIVSNWIGPAFLMAIGGISIKFVISRQFRELAGFLGIAAVVALLVFAPSTIFGPTGIFTKIAKAMSGSIGAGGGGTASGEGMGIINLLNMVKLF